MSLLYLWRRYLELLTNLFLVRHKYICDALVRTMGGRRISQLRKFAKIYDIVPFWFGANPREFYSWNSKIWFRKNRHFSFLQSSYRVRDISRGVKCRDSMLSNNMRSSLWKNFGVIQVFKQTHKSEMKKISMRKTVPLDPLLRKHERHMSCYCTFQIAPNMNDFFFLHYVSS